MKKEKTQVEVKEEVKKEEVKMRQILIEFDNKNINLKVANVSSYFELKGIFESILTQMK